MSCLSQVSVSSRKALPRLGWMDGKCNHDNAGHILCTVVMTFCQISKGMSQNLNLSLENHEIPPSIILNIKPLLILNYKKIVNIRGWVKAHHQSLSHSLTTENIKLYNCIVFMSATNFWLNTINSGKLLEPDNCPEWHPTPGGSDQLTTGVCYYYLLQRMSGCHDSQPIRGQFGLTPANQRAALHLRWSHVTAGWAHTGQVSSLNSGGWHSLDQSELSSPAIWPTPGWAHFPLMCGLSWPGGLSPLPVLIRDCDSLTPNNIACCVIPLLRFHDCTQSLECTFRALKSVQAWG